MADSGNGRFFLTANSLNGIFLKWYKTILRMPQFTLTWDGQAQVITWISYGSLVMHSYARKNRICQYARHASDFAILFHSDKKRHLLYNNVNVLYQPNYRNVTYTIFIIFIYYGTLLIFVYIYVLTIINLKYRWQNRPERAKRFSPKDPRFWNWWGQIYYRI